MQAGIIAAGLDGVMKKTKAKHFTKLNMFIPNNETNKFMNLPTNLNQSIECFEKNNNLKEIIGINFSNSFLKLKKEEWKNFLSHYSSWEKSNAIDL